MDPTAIFNLIDLTMNPAITETFVDILLCAVPIWVAVMIGLLIGWSWRPRWTGLVYLGARSKLRFLWSIPPGLGARRLWLAFTALSAFSVMRTLWLNLRGKGGKVSVVADDRDATAADIGREVSEAYIGAHKETLNPPTEITKMGVDLDLGQNQGPTNFPWATLLYPHRESSSTGQSITVPDRVDSMNLAHNSIKPDFMQEAQQPVVADQPHRFSRGHTL